MEKEFDHIFDVLSSSCPEAINGNELTGICFAEKGDIYRSRIRQAGSNIEYFYVLKALTSDLKSCHTEILYPDITEYPSYINGFAASVDQAVYRYSDYWINELSECVHSYDGDVVGFDYCSGSYINADTERIISGMRRSRQRLSTGSRRSLWGTPFFRTKADKISRTAIFISSLIHSETCVIFALMK